MQLRKNSTTVTELSALPRTDRECYSCEDGNFLKDGHEMVCESCGFVPSHSDTIETRGAWESHRHDVMLRAVGERDGRPRLVGGYTDAYWNSGEYSVVPGDGFTR